MSPEPRSPAVAGQFYAATGAALAKEVEACFTDPRGPGELPVRRRSASQPLVAAVVPHAGLRYSGAIAAHVYARLAAERPPGTVVVLGVDHHGMSSVPATSLVPWRTPLGPTALDVELASSLALPPIVVDEDAHRAEHSIEVQLPFLEYVLPRPRFVPVQVPYGSLEELRAVGRRVAAATRGRDVLLLASSDFSHYVSETTARELDRHAIDALLSRDPARLYDVVRRERISMCGIAPTTALLAALEGREVTGRLLRWGHSGEVEPMEKVVGYAALSFEAPSASSASA